MVFGDYILEHKDRQVYCWQYDDVTYRLRRSSLKYLFGNPSVLLPDVS